MARRIFFMAAFLLAVSTRSLGQEVEPANSTSPLWASSADFDYRYGMQARAMLNASNFTFHSKEITNSQNSNSFANMRIRGWANIGEFNPSGFGFYSQFELGHIPFGGDGDSPLSSETDGFEGVELRRGYFWFMLEEQTQLRIGLQGWSDGFTATRSTGADLMAVDDYESAQALLANSVWDFNLPGIHLLGGLNTATQYRMSLMALSAGDRTFTGDGGAYLIGADLDQQTGAHRIGASVYFVSDNSDYSYGTFGGPMVNYGSSQDLWLGVRGAFTFGDWNPNCCLIYNRGGTSDPDWDHQGWAARLGLSRPIGEGRLNLLALASTGNDGTGESGEFRTIAQSARDNLGAQGYWGYLPISSANGPADGNDLGLSLQNQGLGLMTVQGAWDQPLNQTWSSVMALGWLSSTEQNPQSNGREIGTEAAVYLNWRPRPNMQINLGVAQLFTGDFYASSPGASSDDLRQIFVRLQFEF